MERLSVSGRRGGGGFICDASVSAVGGALPVLRRLGGEENICLSSNAMCRQGECVRLFGGVGSVDSAGGMRPKHSAR